MNVIFTISKVKRAPLTPPSTVFLEKLALASSSRQ